MTVIPLVGLFHLEQNIPLAIAIVVFSSLGFAGGATIQHLAVERAIDGQAHNNAMSIRELLALLKNKLWLIGLATVLAGASLHAVGLALAPVTVVQPVGILAVPWSVLLAAKLHGFRPSKIIWFAVGMTLVGIAGFTVFSATTAAKHTALVPWAIITGVLVVFAAGSLLAFLGLRGRDTRRCLMLASAGSFFFGLSPTMLKILFELLGKERYWTMPLFWSVIAFLLICYCSGGWLVQQAYASGPAEIVVGSMTTTDPIVAVVFGIVVLGEGAFLGPLAAVGMLIFGAIAVGGVVVLSKYHPDALARREPVVVATSAMEPEPLG